jgi:hypothetical protein
MSGEKISPYSTSFTLRMTQIKRLREAKFIANEKDLLRSRGIIKSKLDTVQFQRETTLGG